MDEEFAFPHTIEHLHQPVTAGMTLRDYFAAKAMQGLIHHFDFGTFSNDPMRVAAWAYDAADAMLKARG